MVSTHLKLLASFTISILLFLSPGNTQTDTIIQEICQQIEDSIFCTSTFHQIQAKNPATIAGLNELTLTQATVNVTNTLAFVREEIAVEKNADVVERLKVCQDGYNTVAYSLKKSLEALNGGDYSGMGGYMESMLTEQSRCYENFDVGKFSQNRVHEMSREVKILIAMAALAESYLVV